MSIEKDLAKMKITNLDEVKKWCEEYKESIRKEYKESTYQKGAAGECWRQYAYDELKKFERKRGSDEEMKVVTGKLKQLDVYKAARARGLKVGEEMNLFMAPYRAKIYAEHPATKRAWALFRRKQNESYALYLKDREKELKKVADEEAVKKELKDVPTLLLKAKKEMQTGGSFAGVVYKFINSISIKGRDNLYFMATDMDAGDFPATKTFKPEVLSNPDMFWDLDGYDRLEDFLADKSIDAAKYLAFSLVMRCLERLMVQKDFESFKTFYDKVYPFFIPDNDHGWAINVGGYRKDLVDLGQYGSVQAATKSIHIGTKEEKIYWC